MLYFSKLRIIIISFISLLFILIASNNLLSTDKRLIEKKGLEKFVINMTSIN